MRYYNLMVLNPPVLVGLFAGVVLTFVFWTLTMKAVGRGASSMVEEVRRPFRENLGIMQGTAEPDYATCVGISTRAAQRKMVVPSIIGLVIPLVGGHDSRRAGYMRGCLTGGFAVAVMLATVFGDLFKDPAGPSLNMLITLVSTVSVVFAGLVVQDALKLF